MQWGWKSTALSCHLVVLFFTTHTNWQDYYSRWQDEWNKKKLWKCWPYPNLISSWSLWLTLFFWTSLRISAKFTRAWNLASRAVFLNADETIKKETGVYIRTIFCLHPSGYLESILPNFVFTCFRFLLFRSVVFNLGSANS